MNETAAAITAAMEKMGAAAVLMNAASPERAEPAETLGAEVENFIKKVGRRHHPAELRFEPEQASASPALAAVAPFSGPTTAGREPLELF